jgi:hypothetical protein
MQRLFAAILLSGIAVLGLNCQKEMSYTNPNPINNNQDPINSTLQGNVKDENGRPAMGVTVTVGTQTAKTDARGAFRIKNAALDKQSSLVTAEKSGYFKAFRVFGATSGVNQVTIQLLKKNLAGTVTVSAGGEVSLSNGSKVTLPANGIVKKSGGAYTGTVNVYATYIDPTGVSISELVPGSFQAIDKNNNRAVLSSYGMLAVELESPAGEKLQVAGGSVARLTTAIPASLQAVAPATIPLWYVDEQTGIWREEGTAAKNGNTYVGDVKHFSFWNCDIPFPSINLSMTLKKPDGTPLTYTGVRIHATATYGTAYGYTDSLGQVNGAVPSNMALTLEVLTPCNTVAYTQNIGPFASNTNLGTITATVNSVTTTISGRLLNCAGNPVPNGRAVIIYDNITRYVPTQADGTFSSSFLICNGSGTTCEIYGVDLSAQQQGLPVNVTLSVPNSIAGDITACGTSSAEFINYSIDGEVTNINSAAGDGLWANCYDSLGNSGTYITGSSQPLSRTIGLNFLDNRTAGSFPIHGLYLSNFTSSVPVPPLTINITNFPAVAGFFEGSFSGQFLDISNTTHSVNGTFRVRRQ